MMTVDEIFAEDGRNPPAERSLPWEENRDGVVVVVEPKPHWASDMAAFRLTDRAWCYSGARTVPARCSSAIRTRAATT